MKLSRTSNGKRNHTVSRGKAKVPMVNESESSIEASLLLTPEKWLIQGYEKREGRLYGPSDELSGFVALNLPHQFSGVKRAPTGTVC